MCPFSFIPHGCPAFLKYALVMVIKMAQFSFFVFSADDSKKSVAVPLKYFSEPGRCYLALLENAMDYCSTISKMSTLENTGFRFFFCFFFFADLAVFFIFLPSISHEQ